MDGSRVGIALNGPWAHATQHEVDRSEILNADPAHCKLYPRAAKITGA